MEVWVSIPAFSQQVFWCSHFSCRVLIFVWEVEVLFLTSLIEEVFGLEVVWGLNLEVVYVLKVAEVNKYLLLSNKLSGSQQARFFPKKDSYFQNVLLMSSNLQKKPEFFSRISALASKKRTNKLEEFLLTLTLTLFWFDLFLEARADILEKILLVFWKI